MSRFPAHEDAGRRWVTSTLSHPGGDARIGTGESKDSEGPLPGFTPAEWIAFVTGCAPLSPAGAQPA
jgi:hypothetical protein